uniref:Protein DDB_G0276689-like n=1 Tax=Dermatophagoides pteronyssinus TaxID=6956 RepID=A0A6P6XN54_DERPT|nr:protein DDB_G0276689-like [Dermatophagoides pteronyssinus]
MITMLIMISEWLQWILYFVQNFFKQNILKQTNSSNNHNHNNNGNDDDNLISNSTSQTSYENIISLTFYYAWHVITRKINHNYPDVRKNVLKSESVTRAIEQVSCDQYRIKTLTKQQQVKNICHQDVKNQNEYQQFIRKNRHKAFELYEELSSCISSSLLRIAGWILYRLLSRMFNSVQFSKAQIEQIRQRQKLFDNKNNNKQQQQKSDIPIIYLPLHRSYLDCILITFILSMNGLNPPLIAINDHCCLPFFDNLIRGLGAFFIRKKCIKNNNNVKADHGNNNNNVNNNNNNNNDDDDNENDPIHKAILRSYIIENLRQGNSMEFFLEDSRTSTGKVLMPNLHLLSIVLDALAEGSVQQVCIVPVSISYEKSIEGTNLVVREQMDIPQQQQQQQQRKSSDTFITTIMAIWKTLRSNYGAVRVDFGKPFILNEYMNQCMAQQQIQQQLKNEQRIKQQQQTTMIMTNDNDRADNHHNHNDQNKLYPIPRKIDYGVTIADCVACPPSLDRITHCKKNNSLSLSAIKLLNNNNNNNNNIDDKKNDGLDEEIRRRYRCCDSLAKHVLYDAYRDSSLMSTHLVSFLLLNKYRSKGTTIEQLTQDLDWLRQTICRDKQQNLSINGDSQTLVRQAIQLLRQEELIQTEKVRLKWSSWNNNNHYSRNYHQRNSWNQCNNNDNDGVYDDDDNKSDSRLEIIYLKPSNKLPSLLHLQHYSNYCSSLFVFESVLAISLHTFVQQTEISSLIYDPSTFVSNLSINKREFFQRCRTICSLLQNEFIFTKSCQSLDHMLAKTFIDSFCKHDIFVLNPNKPTGLTLPMSDVANHLYPNNHHHHQNGTNNHHSSSSSTIIKTGKNLPVSYRRLNRWLTSSTRRRRSSMFKNMEGTLQNECILEVDEDRLIDNDNNDDDDEIMDVIDCISDHSLSSSSSIDDNEDNNNNNHHHLPQEFYIRLTEKNCQLLSLYRSILEPYVQAYWFVADCIANYNELSSSSSSSSLKLMNDTKCINYHNQPKNCHHKIIMNINSEQFKQQKSTMANGHSNGYKPIIMDNNNNNNIINIDEKILLKMLITQAKQMAHNGYIYYECASKQTLQNALKFFSSLDNGEDDIMNDLNNDVKQQQYTTTTTTINLERIQAIAESMKIFIRNDKTQSTKSS